MKLRRRNQRRYLRRRPTYTEIVLKVMTRPSTLARLAENVTRNNALLARLKLRAPLGEPL